MPHPGEQSRPMGRVHNGEGERTVAVPSIHHRFRRLAAKWYRETRFTSSIHEIVMNKHYQQIIGLGPPAVPLILAEMKLRPHFWFWALRAITGANPVRKDIAGDLGRMTDAWLGWGRRHGFSV